MSIALITDLSFSDSNWSKEQNQDILCLYK